MKQKEKEFTVEADIEIIREAEEIAPNLLKRMRELEEKVSTIQKILLRRGITDKEELRGD